MGLLKVPPHPHAAFDFIALPVAGSSNHAFVSRGCYDHLATMSVF